MDKYIYDPSLKGKILFKSYSSITEIYINIKKYLNIDVI